jgi:TRAP-type C4-dicarboxylate transport system substrate-binding protein
MEKRKLMSGLGVLLAVLIAISLVLATSSRAVAQTKPSMKPVTLLFNCSIYRPDTVYGKTIMWFCDEVTKRTHGLIKFKYVWAFALTKPGEEIDAINTGLSQAAYFPAVYYPARLFLYNFDHCVFGGSPDLKRAIEWVDPFLYERAPMLHKEIEKEGMKFLFAEIAPSWEIETRMPITKLDDLQGKKIAVAGVYAQAQVAASGAVALSPTMTDRGSMLQTGALDGSVLPRSVSFPFKLYEFAKYNMPVLWGCWLTSIGVIDVKLFNSYPKDIQQILLNVGREATTYFTKLNVPYQEKMGSIMKSAGVTFEPPLSKKDRLRWIDQGDEPITQWLKEAEKRGVGTEGRKLMRSYFRVQEEKIGYEWPEQLKKQIE